MPQLLVAWMLLMAGPAIATVPCLQMGDFASSPSVSYSCAFGLEDWRVTSWSLQNPSGNAISVTPVPGPLPAMQGTVDCSAATFSVTTTVPGSCTVTYSLTGAIQSLGRWTGTFRAIYSGGGCFDCVSQAFAVEAANPAVDVPLPAAAEDLDLAVGPNPTRGPIWFRFDSPVAQPVRLEVFDLLGRWLDTLIDGEWLSAGPHERAWSPAPAERNASGIRFVRLTIGDRSVVRHFVIVR